LRFLTAASLAGACAHHQDPLFRYDGKDYYTTDLPEAERQAVYKLDQEYYEARQEKIRALVLDLYVADLAKTRKVAVADLRKRLLENPDGPSEDEMRAFFDRQKGKLPYSYDLVKAEIKDWIVESLQEEKRLQLLAEVEKKKKVTVYMTPPTPPTFNIPVQGFPGKGVPTAPVTVVEYADFTCPECQKAVAHVQKVLKKYAGKVRYVYKYFPRTENAFAHAAAKAGYCAQQQDRFWQYHDYAFENQARAGWEPANVVAEKAGLDEKVFTACLDDKKTTAFIDESYSEGVKFGVHATPTFFVNGQLVVNGHNADALSKAIEGF